MINTGPGTDCSKEMTIAWHSPYESNYVEYTIASDTYFSNSKRVDVTGTFRDKSREWMDSDTNSVKFYACKAYITNLSSNTNYIYRVGNKYEVSEVKKFKTAAGYRSDFSFAWLADIHTHVNSSSDRSNVSELLNKMGTFNFILFSGDISDVGNLYYQWDYFNGNPSISNYMYATVAGNHDYYKSDNGKNRISHDYYSNKWYLDYAAIPKSTYKDSNYYFIYNKVLFINIDSTQNDGGTREGYVNVKYQIEWFKEVVNSQKGNYDYIIVQQHFSYIIDTEIKYGEFKKWSPVFREYKVDLALGADTHTYSRSAPLYFTGSSDDDYISTSNVKKSSSEGTVYMTSFQLDNNNPSKNLKNKATLFKDDSFYAGGGVGACKIDVTSSGIKLSLYTGDGVSDSVFISKKSR